MNHKELAAQILERVGGKENVARVVHCATRLRFSLNDESVAKTEEISNLDGVISVMQGGGQYQVVIGPDVPAVWREVMALGDFESKADEAPKAEKKGFVGVLEAIASIFQPIIPAITGAGLLKALMALFVALGVLDNTSQTYLILNAFSDAAFYFLPILLASSAAKRFGANQYVAMALGGILVHPAFMGLLSEAKAAGDAVSIFGLPVTIATYSSSVIPIILGVWFMSVVEKFAAKHSPTAVKFFTVPLASLFVAGLATIIVLGPLGTWVGDLIAAGFGFLDAHAAWAVPTLVGALSPLMVMTGTHYGLIPIGVNNLATTGFDTVVGPGMLVSNVAQGAAGFAVALRSKNQRTKELAASSGLTGILGITEPVLYGVNLRFRYPLYAAMIGGAAGGLFLGITGVGRFASGSPGLLVLPGYIGGADPMGNLLFAVIGVAIAMGVSFVAALALFTVFAKKGKLDASETGETVAAVELVARTDEQIVAVADGRLIEAKDIADEAFASELMGKTVAIEPANGTICAPANGTVEMVFETGHAFGLRTADGSALLVHIGIDTVSLDGEGFTVLKKAGDSVKAGEPVVEVDLQKIHGAGLSSQTMLIVSEVGKNGAPSYIEAGDVERGQLISR